MALLIAECFKKTIRQNIYLSHVCFPPDMNVEEQLLYQRDKLRNTEEFLLSEANRILKQDLFAEKNILENLKQYNKSVEVINEEDITQDSIFSLSEIKQTAVIYRLKFLESKLYKPEIPYEAILKIKYLDETFYKNLKNFYVLSAPKSFIDKRNKDETLLFVKTNYDNYALVYHWGKKINNKRKLKFWPMRSFENLFSTVIVITLILTLSLPTFVITLDVKATYWSGYRVAAFFHLLIFNLGVTAFITFAFSKNFSSSIWNSEKDFG